MDRLQDIFYKVLDTRLGTAIMLFAVGMLVPVAFIGLAVRLFIIGTTAAVIFGVVAMCAAPIYVIWLNEK